MDTNYPVFIKGKNISLRPLHEDDLPLLTKWINDADTTQYLTIHLPMSESDERAWLAGHANRKDTDIVLGIVADNKLIGTMGIHQIHWRDRTATTGAYIGEPQYRGKGIGTEAKMLLLNYAFNTLNLHRINSGAIEFNARSIRYNEKCGYVVEGRRRQNFYRNGRYYDEVLLGVLKEDWLPLWEKFQKEVLEA